MANPKRPIGLATLGTVVALAAALLMPQSGALAQATYPTQPVKIVAANTAGTAVDVLARVLAQRLPPHLGQMAVVENRAGGGGAIGADAVARSNPDGYTVLVISPPLVAITPHLRSNLPYDPFKSFIPVTLFAATDNILVGNPKSPATSVKAALDYAKKNPGKLKMAHAGIGFQNHLANLMFVSRTGIDVLQVAYKGAAGTQSVAAGETDFAFATVPSALPAIRAGALVPLGVSSMKRSTILPDAPTIHEAGVENFVSGGWTGLAVPAGTPREVVDALNEAVRKALADPETQDMLRRAGGEPWGTTPEEAMATIKQESDLYGKVIKEHNITLN
jgi:tripartite-type tricarboxylate transporter receptor subunit TctC